MSSVQRAIRLFASSLLLISYFFGSSISQILKLQLQRSRTEAVYICKNSFLFSSLSSIHLSIDHPHHLQKLFLGKYPFLHKQSGKGFLLDYLNIRSSSKETIWLRSGGLPLRTPLAYFTKVSGSVYIQG